MNPAEDSSLLYRGADWDFATIGRIHEAVQRIAVDELGLDIYPVRIEVITAEQMLDAYSSSGMPLLYKHWSFGKHFAQHELVYRKGMGALAYEIVINSNPCIAYVMEENTATMQALVISHAAFGHNHFFKNNYLFRQWTDADGILDYLEFGTRYIASCEERYGEAAVEALLDAAHALHSHAVFRYPRKRRPDLRSEERREKERRQHQEQVYNDLWRTVPGKAAAPKDKRENDRRRALMELPQENILYFLEKWAPRLQPWQREVLRIVRIIAQYFYPQSQTKVMNEGCATYCHYQIMTRLHERGQISDGAFLEFLKAHTNVVYQPEFDHANFPGINPYALGFEMMRDIERICTKPTEEDRTWFPDFAGQGDTMGMLREVWANYRDESFIAQFLSPELMRKWRLFHLADEATDPHLRVAAIHNEQGYRRIRQVFARQYDVAWAEPDIHVTDVDLEGDRRLLLHHNLHDGLLLDERETNRVLQHLADLWGYDVLLTEVDAAAGKMMKEYNATARPMAP